MGTRDWLYESNWLDGFFVLHSFNASSTFSATQLSLDAVSYSFSQEALHGSSLAAMMAGGLAFRLGKVATLSSFSTLNLAPSFRWIPSLLAPVLGLASEVTIFRWMSQGVWPYASTNLPSPTYPLPSSPSSWFTDYINFASLKIFNRISQGQNPFFSHLLQDAGMVAGHHLAYGLNLATQPEGTLTQQFLHAEITNLQMQAGMLLGARLTRHCLQHLERNLEHFVTHFQRNHFRENLQQRILLPSMAAVRSKRELLVECSQWRQGPIILKHFPQIARLIDLRDETNEHFSLLPWQTQNQNFVQANIPFRWWNPRTQKNPNGIVGLKNFLQHLTLETPELPWTRKHDFENHFLGYLAISSHMWKLIQQKTQENLTAWQKIQQKFGDQFDGCTFDLNLHVRRQYGHLPNLQFFDAYHRIMQPLMESSWTLSEGENDEISNRLGPILYPEIDRSKD